MKNMLSIDPLTMRCCQRINIPNTIATFHKSYILCIGHVSYRPFDSLYDSICFLASIVNPDQNEAFSVPHPPRRFGFASVRFATRPEQTTEVPDHKNVLYAVLLSTTSTKYYELHYKHDGRYRGTRLSNTFDDCV